MAVLPPKNLVTLINAVTIPETPRPHLGGSVIGESCMRKLVYSFHWAAIREIEASLQRIFDLGDATEIILVEALQSIGIKVRDQQREVGAGKTGHAGGSIDGILSDVPGFPDEDLLLEAKSMNQSNFNVLVKKKVKIAKPLHYSQMQTYMRELGLKHALYMVLNKNTSELHTEFVDYDDPHAQLMDLKSEEVILAENINEFPRISETPSWFECKMCEFKDVCHYGEPVAIHCRTCDKIEKHDKGRWFCALYNEYRSTEAQLAGCDSWGLSNMWEA